MLMKFLCNGVAARCLGLVAGRLRGSPRWSGGCVRQPIAVDQEPPAAVRCVSPLEQEGRTRVLDRYVVASLR